MNPRTKLKLFTPRKKLDVDWLTLQTKVPDVAHEAELVFFLEKKKMLHDKTLYVAVKKKKYRKGKKKTACICMSHMRYIQRALCSFPRSLINIVGLLCAWKHNTSQSIHNINWYYSFYSHQCPTVECSNKHDGCWLGFWHYAIFK